MTDKEKSFANSLCSDYPVVWCGAEIVCTNYPDLPGGLAKVLPDTVLVYCSLHAFGDFHRVVHFDILNDFWKLSGRRLSCSLQGFQ